MDKQRLDIIEIMMSELARLVNEGEKAKASRLAEKILEELKKIEDSNIFFQLLLEFVNLLSFIENEALEIIKQTITFTMVRINETDEVDRYMLAKFLAIASSVLYNSGEDPREYLNKAESILYELATKKGLVREYASFINLYYAPILHLLGDTKKALKSIEIAKDELIYDYEKTSDERDLALLAEIEAYQAKIYYEIGNLEKAKKLLEDALEQFLQFDDKYQEHIILICKNLIELYKEIGEKGNMDNVCKKILDSDEQ